MDSFLNSQTDQGDVDSEGQFTIAKERALEKLAYSQLPFATAWVLKLIQFGVLVSWDDQIQVKLSRKEALFQFSRVDLEAGDIESAFFDLSTTNEPSLEHLVTALRVLAIKEGQNFQLTLEGCEEGLEWDGETLNLRPLASLGSGCCLAVAHKQPASALRAGRAQETLVLVDTLLEYCFTCSVPLIVDGRRIDALQNSPRYGWGKENFPIGLGFCDHQLPMLRIPLGTFEQDSKTLPTDSHKLGVLAEVSMKSLEPVEQAGLAFLLTYHIRTEKVQNQTHWYPQERESKIFWVQDGVVVDSENFLVADTCCTVACFLSADGIKTDLSSLTLSHSAERERRVGVAQFLIHQSLWDSTYAQPEMDKMIETSTYRTRAGSGVLCLAGIGMCFVNPFWGGVSALIGVASFLSAGSTEKTTAALVQHEVETLIKEFRASPDLGKKPGSIR